MRSRRFKTAILLLLIAILTSCGGEDRNTGKYGQKPSIIFPDGFSISVILAKTDMERARGLMFVSDLPDDRGMLFLGESETQNPFWMKNCLIHLDLLWLDARGTIVDISSNLPPCQEDPCPNYFPKVPYTNVLEVRGNLAAEHGLAVGDRLVFLGF